MVVEAIAASRKALETTIDGVVYNLNLLRVDQLKLSDRVAEVESALVVTRPMVVEYSNKSRTLNPEWKYWR